LILPQQRNRKTLRGPRFLDALEHGASIPNEPPADAERKRHKGRYSWGSNLMPWEIAWNGQLWLEEHLTMTDVREGFRCVSCDATCSTPALQPIGSGLCLHIFGTCNKSSIRVCAR